MEPLNAAALFIFVWFLALAATLEIFGLLRLTAYLHNRLKRRPHRPPETDS